MDELVKDRAMQNLVKQGMSKREAEHEIEFNRELFMKLTVKYGLPLKTDYLESTDKMVSAVFSSCTGDPSPMRKAKLNVDIDDSKVQKNLKDIDKVADKLLKIKGIPESLRAEVEHGTVKVKHNNSFNSDELLKDVAKYLKDNLLADKYNASTSNTNPAQIAGTIANIVEYIDKKHSAVK